MRMKYIYRQSAILINQLILIIFILSMYHLHYRIDESNFFHFTILSLLTLDAAYVSKGNIKNNIVLTDFSCLLLLNAWQFILSLFEDNPWTYQLSSLLIAPVLYQTIVFLISFIFQNSAFRFRKRFLFLLKVTGILSVLSYFINNRLFSLFLLLQLTTGFLVLLLLLIFEHKRILFVINSQLKQLLFSFLFILIPFLCYILFYHNHPSYLENLGSYLMITLSFASIHNIAFKNPIKSNKLTILHLTYYSILFMISIIFFVCLFPLFYIPFPIVLIIIHFSFFVYLSYSLFLYLYYSYTKNNTEGNRDNFYAYSLSHLKHEEKLKESFSNFLHDEILQDLLSIKNLVNKANQPSIQQLIIDTLDSLNTSIRNEMNEYHPTLIKSLTFKDNLENLIATVSSSFPSSSSKIHLSCKDHVFLVVPYDTMIYRVIKELLMNCLKHSHAMDIEVVITQNHNTITLSVIDDGLGIDPKIFTSAHQTQHGLASVQEQIDMLGGTFELISNKSKGTTVFITLAMKGEDSYDSFVN